MNKRKKHQTALLFFSRSAVAESRCKEFVSRSVTKNREVSRLLHKKSLETVRRSGLPYFIFDESRQVGSTFGERLTNAFQSVFEQGFDSVIAVGSDNPALGNIQWTKVEEALERKRPVLGPTFGGGSYLIGLTHSMFNPEKFNALPWKTSGLFDALAQQLSFHSQEPLILETNRDINSSRDVSYFLSERFTGILDYFQSQLRVLLSAFAFAEYIGFFFSPVLWHSRFSRPPPAA